MKKKLKGTLMVLLAAIAALFVFVGCSLGESLEEAKENRNLTTSVTYYANGGKFSNDEAERVIWYQAGSLPLNIGVHSTASGSVNKNNEITRESYEFAGWYYVELDAEGKPVFEDESKKIYKTTELVDFSVALEEEKPWLVAARWKKNTKVSVQLVCDEDVTLPVDSSNVAEGEFGYGVESYKNGDVVKEFNYTKAVGSDWGVDWSSKYAPFTLASEEFQYVEYYLDEACTDPVEWTELIQGEEDVTIYVRYIESGWTIVKDADGVKDMLNGPDAGTKFWIAKDIDASLVSRLYLSTKTFNCEVAGNGFTIGNLTISQTNIGNNELSLFGKIGARAVLKNIVFENLNITCGIAKGSPQIYVAFTSLAEGAVIENVKIAGTLTASKGSSASYGNLGFGTNVYYGGYETDAEYMSASEGKGFAVDCEIVLD